MLQSHKHAMYFHAQKIAQVMAPCSASPGTSTNDDKSHGEAGWASLSEGGLKKWVRDVFKVTC